MVSPTSATSPRNAAPSSASASAGTSAGGSSARGGNAGGAGAEAAGRSSFAALLAEKGDAAPAGGQGGPFGALPGAGSLGGAGYGLAGLAGSAHASGAHPVEAPGSGTPSADGLDADEDPEGADAAELTSAGHEATSAHAPHPALDESLSSWARHCQQMTGAPVLTTGGTTATTSSASEAAEAPTRTARSSLEELMPSMVKKVAWSGDGTRGAVRLELGSGTLAGSTLLVHAEGSRVRVQLDAPSGTDHASWQREIRTRLEARGLTVDDIEVT